MARSNARDASGTSVTATTDPTAAVTAADAAAPAATADTAATPDTSTAASVGAGDTGDARAAAAETDPFAQTFVRAGDGALVRADGTPATEPAKQYDGPSVGDTAEHDIYGTIDAAGNVTPTGNGGSDAPGEGSRGALIVARGDIVTAAAVRTLAG